MQRGPKAQLPSEKRAKGTFQKSRDGNKVEIIERMSTPQQPDWLTSEAQEVWLDDIGRVKLATEADTTLFANYCSLQGALVKAIRQGGEMPPISAFTEVRKMQEVLGIGGARSRVGIAPEEGRPGNVFARNGRK
jgi:phage terminase small subunit